MKRETFGIGEGQPALFAAARSTLVRSLFAAILAAVLLSIAAGWVVSSLAGQPGWSTAGTVAALAMGVLVSVALAPLLSRGIAGIAVRPVELLLDQLETQGVDRFHWMEGRALRRDELEADLKLLQRRMRQVRHQAKVASSELEQVRAQTQQQSLAKSQFLANMSHELRTPLNAILGYAMLLQEDANEAGNASTVADLERIQQAGRNLLALINNILDLSKIEAGRMDLRRAVIESDTLVRAVAGDCGAFDAVNGNRFELSVAPGAEIMVGDADKLAQCLSNLLRNALAYTRGGVVRIGVSPIDWRGAPGIEFAVSDTGIGIEPERHANLFDGFQAPGDHGRSRGSTPGLGLAIVSRLAAMMGGECQVESAPGEGSTFRLRLPLGNATERDDLTADAPMRASADVQKTPAADQTALVVEDDAAALDLMRRWLARMGYNIVSTSSGEAVLALVREHRPHLILLDALLPDRSGYEILEELCADSEIGHIPTILITVDDDRARGLKAGAVDYLRKPITEEQLRAALDVYRRPASGDILLIEDDDASADLLKRSVAQAGFSARRAANGADGLAMANAARPQAIVLDLAMPGMDGFEVITRLGRDATLRDIPLIVVSGRDITIEDHRWLAAAGHRFFMKAVCTPREIAQSLKELVA